MPDETEFANDSDCSWHDGADTSLCFQDTAIFYCISVTFWLLAVIRLTYVVFDGRLTRPPLDVPANRLNVAKAVRTITLRLVLFTGIGIVWSDSNTCCV